MMTMDFPVAVEHGVTFASLTTLGVGGPIRYLARSRAPAELVALLEMARGYELETFILGGGSNLLAADRGFDGLVIQVTDQSIGIECHGSEVILKIGAGLDWDVLVAYTVAIGLAGIECLSGIPGRVGAAPMQNIGAYGQEISETLEGVFVVDRRSGRHLRLAREECGLGYRCSHFKGAWSDRYVLTGIELRLTRRPDGTVKYPELRQHLGAAGHGVAQPTLGEVREAVLAIRRSKSMVLDDPNDPNRHSAGSFFVNPVVSAEIAEEIRQRVAHSGSPSHRSMPSYPVAGGVKLSAAWLIEAAGFRRGYRLGRAALSTRHALAIINCEGAMASDLISLASRIRRSVRAAFGVTLEPEPVFFGFDKSVDDLLG